MSKRFRIFDHPVHGTPPFRADSDGKRSTKNGGPVLKLNAAWRTQIERLVTRLYLLPASPQPQILVFLESEPEGCCSNVCAHSSDLLASLITSPVCLVEANPNAVSLEKRLSFKQKKGLVDLLTDSDLKVEDVAAQVPDGDLWLLTGGFPQPPGASPAGLTRLLGRTNESRSCLGPVLINPPFMQLLDRMNEIRACFSFILIDAPPISASRDALLLAQLADAAVLVLPASGAYQEAARHLKQKLEAADVAPLGVVLTGEPPSNSRPVSQNKSSTATSPYAFKL